MICRKIPYTDQLEALLRLDQLNALHDLDDKTERNAYLCRYCGFWHLTSMREVYDL